MIGLVDMIEMGLAVLMTNEITGVGVAGMLSTIDWGKAFYAARDEPAIYVILMLRSMTYTR